MQPYTPMVRVTSLVLMPLLGEDCVPLSSLLLKTFALFLLLLVIEFVPVISTQIISVPLLLAD